MNYQLKHPWGYYLAATGAPWRGDYAAALRLHYALAQRGQLMEIVEVN